MEISPNILEQLKCSYCGRALSCAPVLMSSLGKDVCGRCRAPLEPEGEVFLRNKPYETSVKDLLFPCCNKGLGCKEMLRLVEAKRHEDMCPFKEYACPTAAFDNRCQWVGKIEKLGAHYKKKHRELMVTHPYTTLPNIKENAVKNFMLQVYGFYFLLQFKCSVPEAKFWYKVVFLGPPHLANLFTYTVHLNNNKVTLIKNGSVTSQVSFTMFEEESVVNKINNLFFEFGEYENIHLKLSIVMKDVKCLNCEKTLIGPLIFQEDNEEQYRCSDCYKKYKKESSYKQILFSSEGSSSLSLIFLKSMLRDIRVSCRNFVTNKLDSIFFSLILVITYYSYMLVDGICYGVPKVIDMAMNLGSRIKQACLLLITWIYCNYKIILKILGFFLIVIWFACLIYYLFIFSLLGVVSFTKLSVFILFFFCSFMLFPRKNDTDMLLNVKLIYNFIVLPIMYYICWSDLPYLVDTTGFTFALYHIFLLLYVLFLNLSYFGLFDFIFVDIFKQENTIIENFFCCTYPILFVFKIPDFIIYGVETIIVFVILVSTHEIKRR